MSRENVEMAKQAIDAFNGTDIDAFTALTTADFEWSPSMVAIEGEIFRGREGIEKYFASLNSAWERFRIVRDRFRDVADVVLMLGRLEGRGKASGVQIVESLGMVFDFREGEISRIRGYLDHDEALRAAGLRSQNRVELVRTLIGRWNAGDHDLDDLPEYVDSACELESPLSSVAGEPYRGYAGFERWSRDLLEQFAEWSIALEDMREIGDQVITIVTVEARGRASDVMLRFRSASVFDFGSDDRVTRLRIYSDVDEALKSMGLQE